MSNPFEFRPAGDAEAFRNAHKSSDTDAERLSMHHTLGAGSTQAAPGNHNHDGDYSPLDHLHSIWLNAIPNQSAVSILEWPEGISQGSAGTAPDGGADYPEGATSTVLTIRHSSRSIQFNYSKHSVTSLNNPDIWYRLIKTATNDDWDTTWRALSRSDHTHDPYFERALISAQAVFNSTTDVDIPGLTLTVPVGATTDEFEVHCCLDIAQAAAAAAGILIVDLMIDGVAYEDGLLFRGSGTNDRQSVSKVWKVTGIAAGDKVFKLKGRLNTGTTPTYNVNTPRSSLVIKKVSPVG